MEESDLIRINAASEHAGEYLESIGKTDLAKMTKEEWRQFLYVVVKNFMDAAPF